MTGSRKTVYRSARRKTVVAWVIAMLLLMVLSGVDYYISEQQRDILKKNAELISLSGRQRTLVQRIALLSRFLTVTSSPYEQDILRKEMDDTLIDLENTHDRLSREARYRNEPSRQEARKLFEIYFKPPFEIDRLVRHFLQSAKAFSEVPNALIKSDNPHLVRITHISHSRTLLEGMERVVQQRQRIVEKHITFLGRVDFGIFLATVMLLLFLTFFIFLPLIRQIIQQLEAQAASNLRLQQRTDELEKSRRAALSIMEDAEIARRKSEDARRASYRLAAIAGASPDGILVCTLEGSITDWNAGAEKLFGYREDNRIGKSFQSLFPLEKTEEASSLLEKVKAGEKIHHHETRWMHEKGYRMDVALTLFPVCDESGRVIGISCISRDISQHKKMENEIREAKESFESFMNHSPAVAFIKDSRSRYTYVNEPMEKIFGLARDAILGKTDYDWLPAEVAAELHEHDAAVLKSGRLLKSVQAVPMHGETHHWLLYKFPISSLTRGTLVGGVAFDITDRMQAEAQLQDYAERLKRSNQELQHFANIVAHDLQEPVHKIVAFSDLVMEKIGDDMDPEARDFLIRLKRATQRMGHLIQDLLSYSRISSRKKPPQRIEMEGLVHEVLSDIELRVEKSGAHIEVGTLPEIIGDATQLRQLFQNLLLNAIKFSKPDEKPFVRIYSENHAENGYVRICVEDRGIGFDPKYREKIFAPFKRLHGRSQYEGTGMGLAICKKIAEAHGGLLRADSSPGQGSVFILEIPEAAVSSSAGSAPRPSA